MKPRTNSTSRAAACALACALILGALFAGCGKSVEAIDGTADVLTGAGAVRAGQQIEADARRQIHDARDRTEAALRGLEGESGDESE